MHSVGMMTDEMQIRRPLDEIVDDRTITALREYIARTGWRDTVCGLRIAERSMRSVLARRPVRYATAVALRVALGTQESQP
jgi:hypothetical protein